MARHVAPGWRSIAVFGRLNVLPVSILAAFSAIFLARIYDQDMANLPDLFRYLAEILDAPLSALPLNLQRTFWLSLCASVAKLGFSLLCPYVIKGYVDFDDWILHSDESTEFQRQYDGDYGRQGQEKLPAALRQEYRRLVSDANHKHLLVRAAITLLLAVSIYLTIRVVFDQLVIVASATDWVRVFI